jgi:hypothetical protein
VEALKVELRDLQHPVPANVPLNPPQNFTRFDTRSNGVCVGGSYPGHHCDNDADCKLCAGGSKAGRVCTVAGDCPSGSCPAGGTCTPLVACTADPGCTKPTECTLPSNGCARWVGKLLGFKERQGPPASGDYKVARLQCTPYYHDWKSEGKITVVGAEIMPSSEYSVLVYASTCRDIEATCPDVKAKVTMYTRRHGDINVDFQPPTLPKQPDAIDIAKVVDSFKGLPTGLPKAISKLTPNLPEHNLNTDAGDISQVVDAVKGVAYKNPPYDGPCPCPSAVTCGTACSPTGACAGRNVCVTTCSMINPNDPLHGEPCLNSRHCGNTCATGARAGLPCQNNADCLSGNVCTIVGTCGTPLCRDACGRCKP